MADAIKGRFDLGCKMIKGGGGIFDVRTDGELIYSKHATGRFPEHHEVLDKLGALVRQAM
ncbi:MAG: Rdx family protein [Phycisphaerae bacterium]|nr:Rdx family protein [Phycisphaerae bacterium]